MAVEGARSPRTVAEVLVDPENVLEEPVRV